MSNPLEQVRLLEGKRVVISGSTEGIGFAVARAMFEQGARVVVNSFEDDVSIAPGWRGELMPFLCGYPSEVYYVGADMSTEDGPVHLVREAHRILGGLDCLVNNAGICPVGDFHRGSSLESYNGVMNLNVRGYYIASREFARIVGDSGNRCIICSGSINADLSEPGQVEYEISKGAIHTMVHSMAVELAGKGIRVNGVAPGLIDTPLTHELLGDPATVERISARIPLGRIGRPEDVAPMYVFLASDRACYITGQIFAVDGGISADQGFALIRTNLSHSN